MERIQEAEGNSLLHSYQRAHAGRYISPSTFTFEHSGIAYASSCCIRLHGAVHVVRLTGQVSCLSTLLTLSVGLLALLLYAFLLFVLPTLLFLALLLALLLLHPLLRLMILHGLSSKCRLSLNFGHKLADRRTYKKRGPASSTAVGPAQVRSQEQQVLSFGNIPPIVQGWNLVSATVVTDVLNQHLFAHSCLPSHAHAFLYSTAIATVRSNDHSFGESKARAWSRS